MLYNTWVFLRFLNTRIFVLLSLHAFSISSGFKRKIRGIRGWKARPPVMVGTRVVRRGGGGATGLGSAGQRLGRPWSGGNHGSSKAWSGAARLALHKAAVVDLTPCNHRRRDRWVRWGLHRPWWLCEEEMAIWLNKKGYIVVRSGSNRKKSNAEVL
jgi:hypothetical protein